MSIHILMWHKEYKDYPLDQPLKKEQNLSSPGIEMHELNGWGNTYHTPKPKKPHLIRRFFHWLLPYE